MLIPLVAYTSDFGPYIPWNPNILFDVLDNLRGFIGAGFNMGFAIFGAIMGVYLLIGMVNKFSP